jgi:hypothetical protein
VFSKPRRFEKPSCLLKVPAGRLRLKMKTHILQNLSRACAAWLALGLASNILAADLAYPIVGTGQKNCYDNFRTIAPPKPGEAFYGQDAQHPGRAASYTLSGDGLTVHDNVTGLTWQRSPDTDGNGGLNAADKLTFAQAEALPARLNAKKLGGFADWRLPNIKELYSLFNASGTDPSGPVDFETSRLTPFIDTRFFTFAYGKQADGDRVIDSQWATSTLYVSGRRQMFGVNFADGRIKGYGLKRPGAGTEKTFFVLCVRGNPAYGKNYFHDNGDGTVSDRATGLMWSKADSGAGMNWENALAWAQKKNAEKYLGHSDWRLPNVKELQGIVDYSRSPDTTHSAAIDPVFASTAITNEARQMDWPFYWSGTTHANLRNGSQAMYLAFGRASGWMQFPPGQGAYHLVDVHGAGAQRSDPKTGDPRNYAHGRGPQGDIVRINNFVRLVRDEAL